MNKDRERIASVLIPADAAGKAIHVILEVADRHSANKAVRRYIRPLTGKETLSGI